MGLPSACVGVCAIEVRSRTEYAKVTLMRIIVIVAAIFIMILVIISSLRWRGVSGDGNFNHKLIGADGVSFKVSCLPHERMK